MVSSVGHVTVRFYKECSFKRATAAASSFVDRVYTTVRHVIPAAVTWVWLEYVRGEIKAITLRATINKTQEVAYLYIHGSMKGKKQTPVLLTHGDYGHPFTTLHLARLAQKEGRAVFSLYIPNAHRPSNVLIHSELLSQAIDNVEGLLRERTFEGLVVAGHSKGGIIAAHQQFTMKNHKIKATCSIAGRLNVIENIECPNDVLRRNIRKTYKAIQKQWNLPLMQIVPKHDENAPRSAMTVRLNQDCHLVPGMHLSGLYQQETSKYFLSFLKKFGGD